VVLLSHRDTRGLRDAHDPRIIAFCKAIARNTVELRADSLDPEALWQAVFSEVVHVRDELGVPLRILIDASTCPRYVSLGLVATCLKEGLAKQVDLSYAEGKYPEPSTDRQGIKREVAFTSGTWRAVAVPGLEGLFDPGKKRFYLVSVGFEGWKTLRVVSRADPDRVSVLMPSPGVIEGYEKRSMINNQDLIARYKIPEEQIARAPAGDAIAAWKALDHCQLERPDQENSFFLCCGTKAHSLGLTLRAAVRPGPAVLYYRPEDHVVVDIAAAGVFWRYEIVNSAVPA
jgi:hypothetical protein